MCKYARLACMLDIITCGRVNTVLITMINWIMLKTVYAMATLPDEG